MSPSAAASPRRALDRETGPRDPGPPSGEGASQQMTVGDLALATPAASPSARSVSFGARYRVEAVLGEGGMGTVYKAYDTELDRMVALKLVRPEFTSDPAASQRFKQELLLASKISHKNVLRIHDLGEAGGTRFISMAYIEGLDLHRLISREGRLPVERTLHIARQLCAALDAAHTEGVVHRDLKPQNILIDQSDTIYVSDFGLAKSLESDLGMTRTGQFLGTPRYMSPEQAEGKPVDHRSDLYAFGLMLCEMLTGDIPFDAYGSVLQVMFQRVQSEPKKPKTLDPSMPDYLARIIERCLERDLEQRYQHARDILADLDAARAPAPSRAAGSVQITLPTGKRLWMAGGIGLLALALLTVFAVPSLRNRVLHHQATSSSGTSSIPALEQGKFVAVLPFRVLGDVNALQYAADGMVEALSAKLFQSHNLHITASGDIEKLKHKESPEAAARELGANLVVHGTVQGTAEKMRIVINLDDIPNHHRLWTQEFSGVPQDLLTLEDQIYSRLVAALELNPSSEELARAAAHPTENVEAYDLYLRGRNAMRSYQNEKNIDTAIGYYNDAIKKDSGFALAYAGLADSSFRMYQRKKDAFWAEKALAAAQQANHLNDKLPEVHLALGTMYEATGKSAEAMTELKRALALAPTSDEVYRRLGFSYLTSNHKEEAIRAYQKAIDLNPYYWVNHNALGEAYFRLGDNQKALAAFQRVTGLEPDNVFGHLNMGAAYYREGRWEECIAAWKKALAIQPTFETYSNLGVAYFYSNRYDEAAQMYEKALEINPNEQIVVGNLADVYRWSGQKDKASTTYDKAIALAYKDLQVNPRSTAALEYLALYYAKKGDSGQALNFIRRARLINRNDVELIYNEAVVDTLSGQFGQAFPLLGDALEKGYPFKEVLNDPELRELRSRPEFARLSAKFGKPN